MPNAPSNAASNTNIATGQSPSAAETKQIVLKEIGAKWSKFSERSFPRSRTGMILLARSSPSTAWRNPRLSAMSMP